MNERTLHRLFQSIVLTSLPLVACGSSDGGDIDGSGGTSTAGSSSSKGGSTAKGGSSSGGSSNGGTESAGSSAGGSTSGGAAGSGTGGTTTAGSGGTEGGSGGTGGGLTCTGNVGDCFTLKQSTVARSCMDDPTLAPTSDQCNAFCGTTGDPLAGGCIVASYDEESIVIDCYPCAAVGRRPAGFSGGGCGERTLGGELANIALLEAVSVQAFGGLRRELAALGAPRTLLRGLSRARRDEVRHARRTRALARRFGGQVRKTPALTAPARSLEAIALENMVEGCVRETFGALVAHYQSSHARDSELRGALARIARDETRHAALSWELHAWLERRLDRSARARVEQARRDAAERLYAELATPAADDPENLAGFPAPDTARSLFRQACPALWA